jgi:cytochrome d ubiquinol oxidase subunit I
MSVSSLTVGDLLFSLTGFVVFYTTLLVVEMYLMVKFARKGPPEDGEPVGGPVQMAPSRAAVQAGEHA